MLGVKRHCSGAQRLLGQVIITQGQGYDIKGATQGRPVMGTQGWRDQGTRQDTREARISGHLWRDVRRSGRLWGQDIRTSAGLGRTSQVEVDGRASMGVRQDGRRPRERLRAYAAGHGQDIR